MIDTAIFDFLNKKEKTTKPAPTQVGNIPSFYNKTNFYSSMVNDPTASDLVIQSIMCGANEFKKLQPRHIINKNGHQTAVTNSSISKFLKNPNPWMTMPDFLEKVKILLDLNKNAYIYPTYYITNAGKKEYTGFYPLMPSRVQYEQDNSNKLYIHFWFDSAGYDSTVPIDEVMHIRKNYGISDYFGGNITSGNDDRGLLKTINEYNKLVESIAKAVGISCQVNGIMKVNTYLSKEKDEVAREEFQDRLLHNESGILFEDASAEFVDLKRNVKLVDAETLAFYQDTILRYTGASKAILSGDYTVQQKESYYEHALESDVINLGANFTKILFTDMEKSFGNEIIFYPEEINFMSYSDKLETVKSLLPAGCLTKNMALNILGLPPLPDELGDVIPQGYNSLLGDDNNNKLDKTKKDKDDKNKDDKKDDKKKKEDDEEGDEDE